PAAWAYETRQRMKTGVPAVLSAIPGPGLFNTAIAGEVAYLASLPKPIPLDAVRAELLKAVTERTAQRLVRKDLETFKTEVAKLVEEAKKNKKTGPDAMKPVRDFIAKFAADRSWQRGASKDFANEWTVEDDANLAPLKTAYEKTMRDNPHGDAPVRFGKKFFWVDAESPESKTQALGTYSPEYYPGQP